eukprot:SAG11_NODE_9885_length_872_cov_1.668823_1_plen_55_part_10
MKLVNSEPRLEQAFRQLDRDGSGAVSLEEFLEFWARRGRPKPAASPAAPPPAAAG